MRGGKHNKNHKQRRREKDQSSEQVQVGNGYIKNVKGGRGKFLRPR